MLDRTAKKGERRVVMKLVYLTDLAYSGQVAASKQNILFKNRHASLHPHDGKRRVVMKSFI